jgi:quinol monooxygenase YgiN
MNTFRAVAVFPYIDPANLEAFCLLAEQMMMEIQKQESILRYDMFFSENRTRCTILEEYAHPEAVFEHVQKNTELLQQLAALGGKIEGGVFPMGQDGEALQEIENNWDATFHNHYIGKVN